MQFFLRKSILLPIIFQLILLSIAFFLFINHFSGEQIYKQLIVFISFIISIIISIFLGRMLISSSLKDAQLAVQESLGESTIKLMNAMEEQNTHFKDQIKKISDMLEENNINELTRYIESISERIYHLNTSLSIDQPIIGALIKSKLAEADIHNIQLDIDISVSLADQEKNALDLARILGNLIDNAFDAVMSTKDESYKYALVKISKVGPLLKIEVHNKGQVIPPQIFECIFDKGYTQKGEGHRGEGLYIVKTLADRMSGTVKVTSDRTEGTKFVVIIPL